MECSCEGYRYPRHDPDYYPPDSIPALNPVGPLPDRDEKGLHDAKIFFFRGAMIGGTRLSSIDNPSNT